MRLAHVDAQPRGVAQQEMVELRAQDVERVRPTTRVVTKEKLHGSRCEPHTNVPPGLRMNPAASIAGMAPRASRIGIVADSSDSPM
jgi:hypothetical protein